MQQDPPNAIAIDEHWNDEKGNPAGGCTQGVGFTISWQHGPLGQGVGRKQPNGAFVEDVIAAAQCRLLSYQEGEFACKANKMAIDCLQQALRFLHARTEDREIRGVEGTHAE